GLPEDRPRGQGDPLERIAGDERIRPRFPGPIRPVRFRDRRGAFRSGYDVVEIRAFCGAVVDALSAAAGGPVEDRVLFDGCARILEATAPDGPPAPSPEAGEAVLTLTPERPPAFRLACRLRFWDRVPSRWGPGGRG
ncbi:hypothetical protein, partial [Alienimonas sp. DA493]|uniref:hypothetical protein n=1 Tax=Alienimonas sp. DA493 TaxID=3373605 RepID=UPI0037545F30